MNNNSMLSYSGKVNIKFNIGNKIISIDKHNTGTDDLFISLANYLAGNVNKNPSLGLIPSVIDIRYSNSKGTIGSSETFLKQEYSIPITRVDISNTNSNNTPHTSVLYEATITYNYLRDSYDASNKYYICLYSNLDKDGNRKRLAYLDFSGDYIELIQPGTQAILTWTLEINNTSSS